MADRYKLFKFGSIGCLVLGAVFLLVGIVMVAVIPTIVKKQVYAAVPLVPGGETTKKWIDAPYDVYIQFWFFNVTNPDEVSMKGAKPSLVETGPYTYTEVQHKELVTRLAQGDRFVKYQNFKHYYWNQEKSCRKCRQDDKITVPNVILMSIGKMVRNYSAPQKTALSIALSLFNEFVFVTKPVKELLFEGYSDEFVNIATRFHLPGLDLPDRVGFFYGKNGSADGVYQVETGVGNVPNVGRIDLWNNQSSLHFWSDALANDLNGTDGTLYPPFVKRTDKPQIFVSDLCRSLYIEYYADISHSGINGYRYIVPSEVFNSSLPQNEGFCVPELDYFYPEQKNDSGLCLPSGLLDISKCQQGNPPVVISSPHFLFTPEYVVDSMIGLHPNLQEHQTEIDLEPTTGVGLKFQRRLQINVAILKDTDILMLKNIANMIVPVLWLNESATINKVTADEIYSKIVLSQNLLSGLSFTLIALGGLSVVSIAITCFIFTYQQRRRRDIYGDNKSDSVDDNTSVNTVSSTAPISTWPVGPRDNSMDNPVYGNSNRSSRTSSVSPSVHATPQIMRHNRSNGPTGVIRFDQNGREPEVRQADALTTG